MKFIAVLLQIIFSISYFSLFVKNYIHFTSSYIKFALVKEIRENNLQNIFYLVVSMQFVFAFGIFLIKFRHFKTAFEILLLLYTAFISSYLIYVNYFYPGCIECSYGLSYINEKIEFTIFISLALFAMYFLIAWLQLKKIKS